MEKEKKENKTKKDVQESKIEKKKNTNIKETKKIEAKVENEVLNNNETKKNGRIYLGYSTRLLLHVFVSVVLFVLCIFYFINGVKFKTNYNLDYDIKPNIKYQVNLKDNSYYKEKQLKEDMQYITDLIDYINVDFNYKMVTSKKSTYNYKYNITADIVVTDRNNTEKILYKDSEVLKEDVIVDNHEDTNVNILENLKIDYQKYNSLVNSFKSKYTVSASSNLVITMHVESDVKNSNVDNDIKDNEDLKITIPLSEQTINILKDYNAKGISGTVSKYSYIKIVNIYCALISVVLLVLDVISLLSLIKFIKKTYRKNSTYTKKINKIMKEYDRIIVKLSKMPDLTNYEIIEISSFDELLDAKQNLDKPILHIEVHKNQKSYFLIFSDAQAYRYVLKEADLEDEKKD